jgi:hypothetical protein
MPVQSVTYNRDKLYDELWHEPATEVAKRYGVSSNALAKICDRLNVPRPPRGYWVRLSFGKVDPRPALPPRDNSELDVVRRGRRPNRERIADSLDEGRELMGPPIIVQEDLEHPHPLVMSALLLLSRAKDRNGLVSSRDERCLDLTVSPPELPRAARIMNALILGLEERGLPVEVTEVLPFDDPEREARSNVTRVLVAGEWVRFGIVERLRQREVASTAKAPPGLKGSDREFWAYWNRPRIALLPTSHLVLQIKEPNVGVRLSWRDGCKKLETRLNDFVKSVFAVADAKKQTREADCSWREAFEAERRRRRQAGERRQLEEKRLAGLRDDLARWKEARELVAFLDDVRTGRTGVGDAREPGWLEWVQAYVRSLDPKVELPVAHASSAPIN